MSTGRPNLTSKQAEVYALIVVGDRCGESPTLSEMSAAMGVSTVTVKQHVDCLVMKGYVTRVACMSRSLSPIEPVDGRYAPCDGDAEDLAHALRALLMLPVDQGMKCIVIREQSEVLKRAHAALGAYDKARAVSAEKRGAA